MQVAKQLIYQFLEGSDKIFVIPVYQRDYAWRKENCQKIWQILIDLKNNSNNSYFLGTFVNIYDGHEARIIVDGQQRITTISLLLLALKNYLKQKTEKNERETLLEQQLSDFLVNRYSLDNSKKIRLKPNKQDQRYFNNIFEENIDATNSSNIITNYNFFYTQIEKQTLTAVEIFDAFKKLEIINIELEKQYDDPQLIFESLNSTGVDLTDADLIRNYILMGLESREQEKLYQTYWIKIENFTGGVAEFIRNYLMFKLQKNVTQTKRAVYSEFKRYAVEEFNSDSEKVLQELLEHSKIYSYFVKITEHNKKKINNALTRLYDIEFSVAYPFLLEVFSLYNRSNLNEGDIVKIIQLIESYAFRKIIINNTQGLNKLYLTLSREIKRLSQPDLGNQFYDIMAFIIKNKGAGQKFPTDEEFLETLQSKEIYKLRSKNRDFLLENLENYNSSYRIDLSNLTVEHIMPQKLNKKWKESLGEDWEDFHITHLHTLGNLTLTAHNSELSNQDFQTKQETDFHTSKLRISEQLSGVQNWNKEAILNRSKLLAQETLKIWKYPETQFKKPVEGSYEEKKEYVLDENLYLMTTHPISISIGEKEIKIKHWYEVKRILCEKFHTESPTEFKEMMEKSDLSNQFAFQKDNTINSPIEFFPGLFVKKYGSTNSILLFAIKLCKYFKYDHSEIILKLNKTHLNGADSKK